MVNLVTSKEDEVIMKEYRDLITGRFPFVSTLINNINYKKSQVAVGDEEKIYYGPGFIRDSIGDYTYRISANSFFQTNTAQAERLYEAVHNFGFYGEKIGVVYDLYAGAGTIALYISRYAEKVFAFESSDSAMADALLNSELNGVENVAFIKADLNKSFIPVKETENVPDPDVIIVDPPRSGMNPNTVKDLLVLNPSKIIYVSCNPTTQVRDLSILCENQYELKKIQPVDMFPNTFHIENVAVLTKRK
jgi:23S rRNA (uracil1939-C5)-methyltransferase